MTLYEKGLPFITINEDLKNFSNELKQMHPQAKVPVLVHDQTVLYESAIITEYIDEQFSDKPLIPKSAQERAQVRLWTYWCNHVFKLVVDQFKYGISRFTEKDCQGCEERLKDQLLKLEARLKEKQYLVGDRLSLADIHVFPFVRQLWRVAKPPQFLEEMVATEKWLAALLARPSFVKTMEKS